MTVVQHRQGRLSADARVLGLVPGLGSPPEATAKGFSGHSLHADDPYGVGP